MTMADAESTCIALGGNLASIHNYGEQSVIRQLIYNKCHSNAHAWIGMFDAIQEGKWMWTDGSKVVFTHWNHGEPNNYFNEHCAVINWNGNYWNDLSCQDRKPFVCAKKV
ncbi:galactose-specific lectin nattectin-like [Thunnus maccoyii]|uniref:galactose-specific lectin nattectin-like n=1 Tax=Thunnus maccoyii TaxID=8240 RepID=UPI001C4D1E1C|nr:galactose-specific lectin nattectin-like [Thunnus maccoyii]